MIVIAIFMLCLLRCFTDNAEVKTNVPRLEQRADEQTFIASAFVQCMGILLAKRSGRADQFLLLKQDRASLEPAGTSGFDPFRTLTKTEGGPAQTIVSRFRYLLLTRYDASSQGLGEQ